MSEHVTITIFPGEGVGYRSVHIEGRAEVGSDGRLNIFLRPDTRGTAARQLSELTTRLAAELLKADAPLVEAVA